MVGRNGTAIRSCRVAAISLLITGFSLCFADASSAQATPADVSVVLASSPPNPSIGSTITYTLTVGNSGTTDSGPVSIEENFGPLWYVANSATCGSVPNCTVQVLNLPLSCPAAIGGEDVNTPRCGIGGIEELWTLSSVAAGASGLTLSVQGIYLGVAVQDTATWSGDGCSTPGTTDDVTGLNGGCATNADNYPGAYVEPSESDIPAGVDQSDDESGAQSVTPGQRIDYSIALTNGGPSPSGQITLEDSLPESDKAILIPGSASCGSVAGCTVTVSSNATCGSSTCAGSLITWVITTLPVTGNSTSEVVTFAATVRAGATGSITNQVLWNGPISPPFGGSGSLLSSGDACVFTTPPSGCLLDSLINPIQAAVPHVTTIETGEPWAGSQPLEIVIGAIGLGLIGCGELRRRRHRHDSAGRRAL